MRITVVVRDKSGALVRGLKREDFQVVEDDKPQTIEAFEFEDLPTERAPEPEQVAAAPPCSGRAEGAGGEPPPAAPTESLAGRRLVVLLFDTNGMEPEQLERAVSSARSYVDSRMTASDVVAVASIGSGLQVAAGLHRRPHGPEARPRPGDRDERRL